MPERAVSDAGKGEPGGGRKRAGAARRVSLAGARGNGDLRVEIARLRAAIRQVSEGAGAVESMPELLRVLDGLGRASVRLASLLRAQRALDSVNRKR